MTQVLMAGSQPDIQSNRRSGSIAASHFSLSFDGNAVDGDQPEIDRVLGRLLVGYTLCTFR